MYNLMQPLYVLVPTGSKKKLAILTGVILILAGLISISFVVGIILIIVGIYIITDQANQKITVYPDRIENRTPLRLKYRIYFAEISSIVRMDYKISGNQQIPKEIKWIEILYKNGMQKKLDMRYFEPIYVMNFFDYLHVALQEFKQFGQVQTSHFAVPPMHQPPQWQRGY